MIRSRDFELHDFEGRLNYMFEHNDAQENYIGLCVIWCDENKFSKSYAELIKEELIPNTFNLELSACTEFIDDYSMLSEIASLYEFNDIAKVQLELKKHLNESQLDQWFDANLHLWSKAMSNFTYGFGWNSNIVNDKYLEVRLNFGSLNFDINSIQYSLDYIEIIRDRA